MEPSLDPGYKGDFIQNRQNIPTGLSADIITCFALPAKTLNRSSEPQVKRFLARNIRNK